MSDGISDGDRKLSLSEDLQHQLNNATEHARKKDSVENYWLRVSEVGQIIAALDRGRAPLTRVMRLGNEMQEINKQLTAIENQCKALLSAASAARTQGLEMTVPTTVGGVTNAVSVSCSLDVFVLIEQELMARRKQIEEQLVGLGVNPSL